MVIDGALVKRKLKDLEEQIKILEKMSFDVDELVGNRDIQDLVCFRLQ